MKRVSQLFTAILLLLVVAGCATESSSSSLTTSPAANSQEKQAGNQADTKQAAEQGQEQQQESVTLTFWNYGNTITDTEFEKLIVEPTKQKYPHITLERIYTEADVTPEDLLAAGNLPDIIYTSSGPSFYRFLTIGVVQELDELIEKHDVNFSAVKPAIEQSLRSYTDNQSIIAIPLSFNLLITYYNKEIFDKFNVPYPSDEPKTWEEWLELGRQLTRVDNGVQYIGIDLGGPTILSRSLQLGNVDSITGKSTLGDSKWQSIYDLLKQQYEIPGIIGPNQELVYDRTNFIQERRVAIRTHFLANMVGPLEELRKEGTELNWDIAPAPHFGDESVGGSIHTLIVSKQSKHIEDAFLVAANVLSEDTQRLVARNGRVPAIVNPELEQEFGADIEVLHDKKVENVFKLTSVPNNPPHSLDPQLNEVLENIAKDIALNGKDIVSAIRAGQEESDRLISSWEETR